MSTKRLNVADEKFSRKKAFGFAMTRASSILSSLLIGQITYFGTNSLGLAAAAIASAMGVKASIDAVTDLFMGVIIDRTDTKWGKARPYCLSGVMVWICVLAIFCVPSGLFEKLSADARNMGIVIYITIFGTLASAIFETMRGIAFDTHLKRSVVNDENRVKIMTIGGVIFSIGSLGMQVALPIIIQAFHGSQEGFMLLAIVFGVMGIAASIAGFLACPEYTKEELDAYYGLKSEQKQKKVKVLDFLKNVGKNKYILMWTVLNFLVMLNLMGAFNSGQYYFQFVFGDLGAYSAVMAVSAVAFPVMFFIPKLCKKFGVVNLIRFSMVLQIVGIVIRMIVPDNLLIQCVCYFLFTLPNIPFAFVGSQVTIECMEYGQYKTGIVVEAMYSSFINFSQKMSTSLGSVILGVVLTATGFDYLTNAVLSGGFADWAELAALGTAGFEQYVTGGAQTVSNAIGGISIIYNVIPLVAAIVTLVMLFFFNLEKDLKVIRVQHGLNEDGSQKE